MAFSDRYKNGQTDKDNTNTKEQMEVNKNGGKQNEN